jgi:NurA-like 5'-3' nuclease
MEINKNELLNALLAEIPAPLQADEVTIELLMDAAKLSREGARGILERKAKTGEFIKRQALRDDGKIVSAYRKAVING